MSSQGPLWAPRVSVKYTARSPPPRSPGAEVFIHAPVPTSLGSELLPGPVTTTACLPHCAGGAEGSGGQGQPVGSGAIGTDTARVGVWASTLGVPTTPTTCKAPYGLHTWAGCSPHPWEASLVASDGGMDLCPSHARPAVRSIRGAVP